MTPKAIGAIRLALEASISSVQRNGGPPVMDPRFPAEAQFDVRISEVGLKKFAGNGNVLRCVDIAIAGIRPIHGDYVLVERRRNDVKWLSAKRLLEQNGDCELWSDGDDSIHREPVIKLMAGRLQNEDVRILAKIICCYKTHAFDEICAMAAV